MNAKESSRIVNFYSLSALEEGQWIDVDVLFEMPFEFSTDVESFKRKLRRLRDNQIKPIGFKILGNPSGGVKRRYYIWKNSLYYVLLDWNLLSFKSRSALESKLNSASNQYLENMVEEVKDLLVSKKATPTDNESEIQISCFEIYNKIEEFLKLSKESKASYDISSILLDIKKNNLNLLQMSQLILQRYESAAHRI